MIVFALYGLSTRINVSKSGSAPSDHNSFLYNLFLGFRLVSGIPLGYAIFTILVTFTGHFIPAEKIIDAIQIERSTETVADIDGNVYHTIKIDKQIWTVENLKTTKYNDGTPIPLVKNDNEWRNLSTGSYCYYNNDEAKNSKYGTLYNYYAVKTGKLAPKGWHVPTNADWIKLEKYLVANGYNFGGTKKCNKLAKSIAAQTDWASDSSSGTIGNDLTKNNRSGFSALPGGFRNDNGFFDSQSFYGYWWNATDSEYDTLIAYYYYLSYDDEYMSRYFKDKRNGFSVRLLRD